MATSPDATPPGKGTMVWRGLVHRCPVCGSGHLFRHWFTLVPRCPRCSLRFRREAGSMTGDIGINTIVSFGALLITMLVFFLATWPELPVTAMVVTCVAVTLIMPVLFFPSSKTLWLAFDLMFNPLQPGEVAPGYGPQLADEAAVPTSGNGSARGSSNGSSNGRSAGSPRPTSSPSPGGSAAGDSPAGSAPDDAAPPAEPGPIG